MAREKHILLSLTISFLAIIKLIHCSLPIPNKSIVILPNGKEITETEDKKDQDIFVKINYKPTLDATIYFKPYNDKSFNDCKFFCYNMIEVEILKSDIKDPFEPSVDCRYFGYNFATRTCLLPEKLTNVILPSDNDNSSYTFFLKTYHSDFNGPIKYSKTKKSFSKQYSIPGLSAVYVKAIDIDKFDSDGEDFEVSCAELCKYRTNKQSICLSFDTCDIIDGDDHNGQLKRYCFLFVTKVLKKRKDSQQEYKVVRFSSINNFMRGEIFKQKHVDIDDDDDDEKDKTKCLSYMSSYLSTDFNEVPEYGYDSLDKFVEHDQVDIDTCSRLCSIDETCESFKFELESDKVEPKTKCIHYHHSVSSKSIPSKIAMLKQYICLDTAKNKVTCDTKPNKQCKIYVKKLSMGDVKVKTNEKYFGKVKYYIMIGTIILLSTLIVLLIMYKFSKVLCPKHNSTNESTNTVELKSISKSK